MGFNGYEFVAKTPTSLEHASAINDLGEMYETNLDGDWRLGSVSSYPSREPMDIALELAAQTGFPAIAMYVFDSTWADGYFQGLSPAASGGFYLCESMAIAAIIAEYELEELYPKPGISLRNDSAVPGLIAWAADAGLVTEQQKLVRALAREPGAMNYGVLALAAALGIAVPQRS